MTDVTQIVTRIEQGDPGAADQLLPLVYEELRRLASQKLARERPGRTLQATALVHEAYLRLVGNDNAVHWNGRGHTAQIESLVYSADGSFLASGSNDRTARLWDLGTELEITTFSGHTGQVDNIAVSRDGTKLATGGGDRIVRLWDIVSSTNGNAAEPQSGSEQ